REEAGAMMRRLDDGSNTKDGQPGNMYRHLGRKEERAENLKLFKKWIGEDAWSMKKTAEYTEEDLRRIKAKQE
ncbi:MAG: cytochrome C, partial [Sulfuritalea sp.]|nr:cytochrome C [Sulfuritalea sp.]